MKQTKPIEASSRWLNGKLWGNNMMIGKWVASGRNFAGATVFGFFALFPCLAGAEITSLNLSQATVDGCQDYFTSEWAEPLDMNQSTDILYNLVPREVQQLSALNFENGIFSTSATGGDPYFRILTWVDHFQGGPVAIPDDSTRFGFNRPIEFNRQAYRTLSFRMFSSIANDVQVLWDKHEGSFGFTVPIETFPGWHTYSVDLPTVGLSDGSGDMGWTTGKVVGLRIDPARNAAGTQVKFDWIQLTKGSGACSALNAQYTSSSQDRVSLFVDDNLDPMDGYHASATGLAPGSGSNSFTTATLFPGNYKLYGIASKDFATLHLNPWDMDDGAGDVDSSRIFGISTTGTGFGSSKFCGTPTNDDANFYLKFPLNKPIDASVYSKFAIRLETGAGVDALAVFFFDTNQAVLGATNVATNGTGTYQIDMSQVAGWSGQIGGLRISPVVLGDSSAKPFCIDWVTLGSDYVLSESTLRAPVEAGQTPVVSERPVATFVQPDREGGEDFFVAVRGKPSDMSSVSDIQHADNLTEAYIYPGNAYTDSAGKVKVGDFFYATSLAGSDDPTNFSVFLDNQRTIDPTKYKIACFTLDVIAPVDIYHSVARILFQHDSININGDDLVLKSSGEARYCLRMDTLQIEPNVQPGQLHPWRKNSDGSGINYWRIDAHEESHATSFRFQDIRLAADHQADDKFMIVVDGQRDKNVNLYYSGASNGTQGSLIGTMTAGRNTDTFLWNTSGVPEGTWFIYLTVGTETFLAPGAVVVRHSGSPDSTAPTLQMEAPLPGHRFTGSLELAGYAIDNVRLARIEAFIDGQLVGTIVPSGFRKDVRDAFPTFPFASHSGFQQWIDLSGVSMGSHTLVVKAYDTVGNLTEYQAQVERVGSDPTAAITYPVPNEARLAVPIQAPISPQPTAVPPTVSGVSLSVKANKKEVTLQVSGAAGCAKVEVLANIAPNKTQSLIESKKPTTLLSMAPSADGVARSKAVKLKGFLVPKKKADNGIYFVARCDGSRHSKVVKVDSKKIGSTKLGKIKNVKAMVNQLKSRLKKF